MNERIEKLYGQSFVNENYVNVGPNGTELVIRFDPEKFAELIVEAVLDQVKERAYYTGDRDWSDEVDRPWIQLEFGYGSLADAQKGIFK
jgi:hypothetical protein